MQLAHIDFQDEPIDALSTEITHRLAARQGKKRAIMAVAHAIVVSVFHRLARHEPYHELGPNY